MYHDKVDAGRAARDLQRVMTKRTLHPGALIHPAAAKAFLTRLSVQSAEEPNEVRGIGCEQHD